MLSVTYLDHSGFFAELERHCILFDWWRGALPEVPAGKALIVCVSHAHEDHFRRSIFSELDEKAALFLVGADVPAPDDARVFTFSGGETTRPLPGVSVSALRSTDEGVAFLLTLEGLTIYHAGDLHWWHWEGEPAEWNREMAVHFKAFTAPLKGRRIDLAFLPLDPRLASAADRGIEYYFSLADIRHVLPMHQWGDYGLTERYLKDHPERRGIVTPVSRPGEQFLFDDLE